MLFHFLYHKTRCVVPLQSTVTPLLLLQYVKSGVVRILKIGRRNAHGPRFATGVPSALVRVYWRERICVKLVSLTANVRVRIEFIFTVQLYFWIGLCGGHD